MKKKVLPLLLFAVLLITLIPFNAFANEIDAFHTEDLVIDSLENYPEIGDPDADFSKGVRIGNTVYTITDEKGNDPFKGIELNSDTKVIVPQDFATTGILSVTAYPAYYEDGYYYSWSSRYMDVAYSQVMFRVDLYPTTAQYNNWVSAFNNAGKTWSHFKLRVQYKFGPDAIQFLLWDQGGPIQYGVPSDYNYLVTATTFPQTGQYVGGGSEQSMTYQKSDLTWKNAGTAWVYNRTK